MNNSFVFSALKGVYSKLLQSNIIHQPHPIKLSDLIKSHSFWIKDLFGVEYKFPDPETFILIVPDQKPIPITNGGPFILVKKSDNSIIRNYFFHVKEIRSI